MSVQSKRVDTCPYCNGPRNPATAVEECCSRLCYHKKKGDKLLNLLRHNHCKCAQCGATLKTIEEPTDEQLRQIDGFHSKTAVIGFQYRTPHAETGEKDIVSDVGERVVTGTICSDCGATNTSTEFPEIQNRFLFEYAIGIFEALEDKYPEHQTSLDRSVFLEMLYCTEDIAFSLGKAAHE